ncbi:hypothetical protein SAMN05216266_12151 [Amycolatopsis marina]|uniref:Extracellular solute-binding protein n=1 Tax=Amycolatopsis marina TaxID=490629 RepID=A0A1I1CBI2_9PSEU|nr:hypothetical protein [Amycolatopsis marina]SFB57753.1 hypothetical protein SAMN05216266_12151 [Amycolatopsis marina]
MGRHSRVEPPAPPSPDSCTSTGTHRAIGRGPRRRIAAWPIACAVLVALLGLGWVGWNWADDMLNRRAEAQASSCPEGDTALRVVVTPSAEKAVTTAAQNWNQANTVVRAHCIRVDVDAVPSRTVLDALTGKTGLDTIGGLPAGWIPESSWWTSELDNIDPRLVGSPAESVASSGSADYPFIGLAGDGIDVVHKHAAQSFRAYLLEPAQQEILTASGM